MKRILRSVYAWGLLILTVAAMIVIIFLAMPDLDNLITAVVGTALSLMVVPMVHELGHAAFACFGRMEIVYCKFFAFKFYRKNEKLCFGFANPLAPEETQVLPKGSENMQKRAYRYTIGGLVFSGALLALLLGASILAWCLGSGGYAVCSWLPYAAYLFLLNVAPFEYPSGKTDALVARGIRKQEPVEQTMINLMRIHGGLQEGKSYGEIEEEFYFSAPQIPVDEPLYVAILDARYCFYLEKKDVEKAYDCLKRIRAAGEYLTKEEVFALERNLAYICLLKGSDAVLKKAVHNDEKAWQADDVAVKRILAVYMCGCGDDQHTAALVAQAEALLPKLYPLGLRKHEEILLSRIN